MRSATVTTAGVAVKNAVTPGLKLFTFDLQSNLFHHNHFSGLYLSIRLETADIQTVARLLSGVVQTIPSYLIGARGLPFLIDQGRYPLSQSIVDGQMDRCGSPQLIR